MKKIVASACAVAFVLGVAVTFGQEGYEAPKPMKEHEWLQQVVGDWTGETECVTEPGKPPMKGKNAESTRSIGGFWVQSEVKGDAMGTPFTGLLTVGFDPEKKRYVGTWIDSMGAHLWQYVGSVDASGKVLTLETEGPNQALPGKTCKFRESIEITDKDHKTFTSTIEQDGAWVTFMTARYTRKK